MAILSADSLGYKVAFKSPFGTACDPTAWAERARVECDALRPHQTLHLCPIYHTGFIDQLQTTDYIEVINVPEGPGNATLVVV